MVIVPKQAAGFQRSYLRIFSWNDSSWGHELKVPLSGKKVITDGKSLDRRDPEAQRMYFVLVDRFKNGDPGNDQPVEDDRLTEKTNFHGGDIKGITQQIERGYFDSLNINAIWLSPITQNPLVAYREYPEPRRWYSGYHGYWPIRSGKVDHRFGSENDLRELIETAHEHGISILLDYVCNHVHEDHPVIRNHPEYATEFDLPDGSKNIRLWDDQRLTTWFDDFLPSLDLSNPEVIRLQSDSALFWLQEFGIDGFRHDATKHIPEIFWQTLTRKIKDSIILTENRPVYQIGETYGKPELISRYIDNGLLDAQFDFNLFFMVRDQLAKTDGSLEEVAKTLLESLRYYGFSNSMGYISGNHDQPRFTAYASGALLFNENERLAGFERDVQIKDSVALDKMAQLIAFNNAIPGVPVLFYGDEIGLTGAGDPDNRRPMRFDSWSNKEMELWQTIQKIQRIRASEMPLIYGDTEILLASKNSLVIKRKYFDQEILFCLNSSDAPLEITIPINQLEEWHKAKPLIGNASMMESVSKSTSIIVPSNSFDFVKK
jgi:glycosidase